MKKNLLLLVFLVLASVASITAQRQPVTPNRPFVVKTAQDVSAITKTLAAKPGNTSEDVASPAGIQARVAVFHDEKRVDDLIESHDLSDDVYYVLSGTGTLHLGGKLIEPKEISPGEWRSKTVEGGTKITLKKGDLIFVPRGTPHQRTVTKKGFSMILVKIFAEPQQPMK